MYATLTAGVKSKIELLWSTHVFDTIASTYTWIDMADKEFLSEFETEGYNIFQNVVEGTKRGGI